MVLGMFFGLISGAAVAPAGELGKLLIQCIKVIAAPLLFFAIVHSVLASEIKLSSGCKMIVIALFNASIALAIGLGLSNYFQPGRHLSPAALAGMATPVDATLTSMKPLKPLEVIAGFVPTSILQPLADNVLLTLAVMALVLGIALRRLRDGEFATERSIARGIDGAVLVGLRTTELILSWIVRLTPLGVFGVVAKAVGMYGFAPLKGLGIYLLVGLGGLAIQVLVTYQIWIRFVGGIPLKRYWSETKEAVVYSAGANSSLATLPLTLKALDRLGVSRSASTLGACVGTNLNNDGILLYEAMAALLVAQAHGIDLSLTQQALIAVMSMIAALGISGIPDAGIVSLSLVLVTAGLPTELLPLLLTVDWIIARARSVTNVVADTVVSIGIDRWVEGRVDGRHKALE